MVHGCVGVLFLLFLKGKYILNCPKVKTKSPTPTAGGDGFPGAMAPAQGRGCEARQEREVGMSGWRII